MTLLTCPKPSCADLNPVSATVCETCGTWLRVGHLDRGYLRDRLSGDLERVHRQVAGKTLGRPLTADEVVHHINGDKLDNRPENLYVTSASNHSRLHGFARRRKAA